MKNLSILLLCLIATTSFAYAPVEDYSTDVDQNKPQTVVAPKADAQAAKPSAPDDSANLSTDQRLKKAEQQIANLNQQDMQHKIDDLQDKVQKLNGQVAEQGHQIDQLNDQMKNFYLDLNRRLDKDKILPDVTPVASVGAPVVEATGTAVAGAVPAGKTIDKNAKKTPTTEAKKASQLAADNAFLKEQQTYQTAIDLLPDKKYDESIKKLQEYLTTYPKGVYVSNAHYWLGEVYFLQHNFVKSESEFKIIIGKYATSKKLPDAYYKIALIHHYQNKNPQAKDELKQLIKRYPDSSAAGLAKQQLELMN